jgi:acylphosphatase
MNDGRVEILAQSFDEDKLLVFIESIKSIKFPARVDDVSKTEVTFSEDVKNFIIIR